MLIQHIKTSVSYLQSKMHIESNTYWNIAFTFVLVAVAFMIPTESFAKVNPNVETGNEISNVICNIVSQLQGPVARGVAAFGIIFLGFSLFLGKISWGVALALGIGIGAIFGADQIVALMAGSDDACIAEAAA